MATQMHNGGWTATEPLPDAFKTLQTKINEGTARRFLVGSPAQIKEEKSKISIEDRLASLEKRLDRLEFDKPHRESLIVSPTSEEIKTYG